MDDTAVENEQFKEKNMDTWSDKAFMGTVVNRTLSSLHGVSLEITLTVSLSRRIYWPLRGDGERNKRIEISPNVPS